MQQHDGWCIRRSGLSVEDLIDIHAPGIKRYTDRDLEPEDEQDDSGVAKFQSKP